MEDNNIRKTRDDTRGQEENENLDLHYRMSTRNQKRLRKKRITDNLDLKFVIEELFRN